jgi:hypothetical protein
VRRRGVVDLEILEAVVAHADAHRAVHVLLLQVGLPEVGRLEDVAVGINGAGEGKALDLVGHGTPVCSG